MQALPQMTNSTYTPDTYGSNVVLYLLQGIFLFFLIKYKPLKYNNVYTYPDWGYGIGWFMAMSSMVCIPLGIIWMIWKTPGTFTEVNNGRECVFLNSDWSKVSAEDLIQKLIFRNWHSTRVNVRLFFVVLIYK